MEKETSDVIDVLEDSSSNCQSLISTDENPNDSLPNVMSTDLYNSSSDDNELLPREVTISVEGTNKKYKCLIV